MIRQSPQPPSQTLDAIIRLVDTEGDLSFRRMADTAGLDPAADFIGASLRCMDFRGEDLRGFNFRDADLSGSDFRNANVTGVNFRNATLIGVIGLPDTHNLARGREEMRLGNWKTAIEFLLLALVDGRNSTDVASVAARLLGTCYEHLGDLEEAERVLNEALRHAKKASVERYEASIALSSVLERQEKPTALERALQEALGVARALDAKHRILESSIKLFRFYVFRSQFDHAAQHAAFLQGRYSTDIDIRYRSWLMLAEIAEMVSNFSEVDRQMARALELSKVQNLTGLASDFGRLAELAGNRGAHDMRRKWLDLKKEVLVRQRTERAELIRIEQLERLRRKQSNAVSAS